MNTLERNIQHTDHDALACRVSAARKMYIDQGPWLQEYVTHMELCNKRVYLKVLKASGNKLPTINYGTYLRTVCIDAAVNRFCEENPNAQFVNLGAGSDTRGFSLLSKFPSVSVVEVDFAESMALKTQIINDSALLTSCVKDKKYRVLGADLRKDVDKLLELLDPALPTIVVSECMLCYTSQQDSNRIIKTLGDHLAAVTFAIYDPIGGEGNFGEIMLSNLKISRHLGMPTLLVYNTEDKYRERMVQLGFANTTVVNMWQYYCQLPPNEQTRLKRLELLDEIEELRIMFSHYVLVLASK